MKLEAEEKEFKRRNDHHFYKSRQKEGFFTPELKLKGNTMTSDKSSNRDPMPIVLGVNY